MCVYTAGKSRGICDVRAGATIGVCVRKRVSDCERVCVYRRGMRRGICDVRAGATNVAAVCRPSSVPA